MWRAFLFLFLFSPVFVQAAEYAWGQYGLPSPKEACEAEKGANTNVYAVRQSETIFQCWGTLPSGYTLNYGQVSRAGDSCPANTTYNSETGECEKNKCEALNGTSKAFSKTGTAPDGYMKVISVGGKPTAVQSTEGCFDGCLASTTDQKCTTKVSGLYLCRGTAYFTGQSCDSAGKPGIDESSTAQYPQTESTENSKPCSYSTNSDGTQSCISEKNSEKDGQVCGTVSATGAKICVDKQPSKNGLQIDTTVKTEADPDGGTKTTKTDKATTTECTAIKTCTSTTTTVTTVVNGKGNTTSTCTGANCPDKTTNPDGNGDGFGDCVSGDCGSGEGGDAGGLSLPKLDDVPGFGESAQEFVDKVSGSRIANAMGNVRAPGGSCPIFQGDAGFLGHLTIDGHCSVIAGNESLIRLAAKTIWALLACWILLG